MSICFTFYPVPEIATPPKPALLSPTSQIYYQQISCNAFMPPPLIVMYKMRCKTDTFSQFIEICVFAIIVSLAQKKFIKILTGLDVSYVDIIIPIL